MKPFSLPRWLLLALILTLCPFAARAQMAVAPETMTPATRGEIESVVRDYLTRHPEVIIEALRQMQEQQQSAQQEKDRAQLKANRKMLENDGRSFTVGPEHAAVTVVEFFDYRCPYCKQMAKSVQKLVEERKNVRVVFKELPVLGPDSVAASRAALAVLKQAPDKYLAFHRALLGAKGPLTEQRVFEIAEDVGIAVDRMRAGMDDPEITATLTANHKLAEKLDIQGTPTFVIGDALVPGAVEYATLIDLIEEAAESCAGC